MNFNCVKSHRSIIFIQINSSLHLENCIHLVFVVSRNCGSLLQWRTPKEGHFLTLFANEKFFQNPFPRNKNSQLTLPRNGGKIVKTQSKYMKMRLIEHIRESHFVFLLGYRIIFEIIIQDLSWHMNRRFELSKTEILYVLIIMKMI